ncbi:MAG: isocitrate/isopropylmalate family dehydrogenase, partial [Candidatus Marinamargulisbacteria bacterium]|nr:isocitrate/isopropylmalate family dehydrogenase [Candidatus Marinamargulisbacteria bacterium]
IIKTTDGLFSAIAKEIAADYPTIQCDEWYIDIMTANLINPATQSKFQVLAMPNLYGDILSDEAAQIQGGVGTAGSANIGDRWAMFEAVHGSAPRMIEENRAEYADPSSMIKAAQLLLSHIGYSKEADQLEQAMTVCSLEKRLTLSGHSDGCTGAQWADYIMETYDDPQLSSRYTTGLSTLAASHS